MGCCTTNRPKPQPATPSSSLLPELELSPSNQSKSFTLSIQDLKFSKSLEKVSSFPFTTYLKLNNLSPIPLGDIWGLITELSPSRSSKFSLPANSSNLALSFLLTISEEYLEIGSTSIDLQEIEDFFQGTICLTYRGLKSIFIQVKLTLDSETKTEIEDYEDLSLSTSFKIIEKKKSSYFPIKTYPIDMKKYYTPNFLQEKTCLDLDLIQVLDRLKDPKLQFEEIEEILALDCAEVLYYALNRLEFYAGQSNYARRMLVDNKEKFYAVFRNYCYDCLVVETALQVIFEGSRTLDGRCEELRLFYTSDFIESMIKSVDSQKICVYSMEIIIKYLQTSQTKPDSTLVLVLKYSLASFEKFPKDETASSALHVFFQLIQNLSLKSNFSSIFNETHFESVIFILQQFKYNQEIIKISLKLIKVFLSHKKFKEIILESSAFDNLSQTLSLVNESNIQKLALEVVKEVVAMPMNNETAKTVFKVLITVLNNSVNSAFTAKFVIGLLSNLAHEVLEMICSQEALDCFSVLLVCLRGEVEVEVGVVRLMKMVKDLDLTAVEKIRNHGQIVNCLREIEDAWRVPSTGSNHSYEEDLIELKQMIEDLFKL